MKLGQTDIFVVDDEKDNLELLRRALFGYNVHPFEQPRAALLATLANHPTCLVVDYRMPDMNGVELVREARIGGYEGTVLMVTAFPERDDIVKAGQAELIYRIVAKPIRAAELREQLELAIADSRFRSHLAGRRRRPRFSMPLMLEVRSAGGWLNVAAKDVSISGLRLDWTAPLGTQLALRLKRGANVLETNGRVVRVDRDGVGLEFVNPPPTFRRALGVLITRHRYAYDQHVATA